MKQRKKHRKQKRDPENAKLQSKIDQLKNKDKNGGLTDNERQQLSELEAKALENKADELQDELSDLQKRDANGELTPEEEERMNALGKELKVNHFYKRHQFSHLNAQFLNQGKISFVKKNEVHFKFSE